MSLHYISHNCEFLHRPMLYLLALTRVFTTTPFIIDLPFGWLPILGIWIIYYEKDSEIFVSYFLLCLDSVDDYFVIRILKIIDLLFNFDVM